SQGAAQLAVTAAAPSSNATVLPTFTQRPVSPSLVSPRGCRALLPWCNHRTEAVCPLQEVLIQATLTNAAVVTPLVTNAKMYVHAPTPATNAAMAKDSKPLVLAVDDC